MAFANEMKAVNNVCEREEEKSLLYMERKLWLEVCVRHNYLLGLPLT